MDVIDGKMLSEALATVKIQLVQMKRSLDADQLMDALKSASTMLAELRTSSLSPKQYYELYMAVFDALRHLSAYLYEAHVSGKHHLADLYELVQYAGNIVPRLYLMITVGTVYMSIPDAPVKEIMKDMMEMTRGVQHPTRGLFLRHYLSGMTRDHLPIGLDPGPSGNLHDSLGFVLTNFIEMNKLWVRLQHQGLSRDREKREMERKELRILVGTNLVRLSQLDGVDLEMYQRMILPAVLEQVVNCKDTIAQEYLMEVVIQVFTDDFHLRTLGPFLSATAQLHPKVNIKQIVTALIDRLAAYAAREAENESPEETRRQEEEAARRLAAKIKTQKEKRWQTMQQEEARAKAQNVMKYSNLDWGPSEEQAMFKNVEGKSSTVGSEDATIKTSETNGTSLTSHQTLPEAGPSNPQQPVRKFRGIPENVPLFEVFWHQVVELIRARPDLSIQDVTALLVSLTNLALSCYPDRLEYVDQVLGFAKTKVQEHADSPDLHHPASIQNLLALLLAPINSYLTVLTLLALPNFQELLLVQPFLSRRAIGHSVVASILKNETSIADPVDCKGVLDMCHVLVRDQRDASIGMPTQMGQRQIMGSRGHQAYDPEEMAEEQGWLARMIHLLRNNDLDLQTKLLQEARKAFSEGGDRIRWTYPPLVICALKLAHRYTFRQHFIPDWEAKISALFKWIHQVLSVLYSKVESSEICLRLYLQALLAADVAGLEELAYEFAVQAFTIYEESISESRAQLQAIVLIIGALQTSRVFGVDNYDTLITKAALHGAKLLKKSHQATAVALASHLWWQTEKIGSEVEDPSKDLLRDGKRVLECLQKSLRIATSSIDELTSVQLYCDALDQYIYYFERQNEAVSTKHLNSLVELITSNLDSIQGADGVLVLNPSATNSGLFEGVHTPDAVLAHFQNQLKYIQARKDIILNGEGEGLAKFEEIDISGAMLKVGLQP
ncbi:hypothetical protein CROQUDRAFT_661665 [Cronartium quercuum f. sp. fusiforme G11]|uniref:Vacuolar protein sorting-associated protein 35 n=1 Tax=Cronartium quercuum f. sp. fusiforme G11 TaxID=708437 RepID=A0A9P6TA28_9BASI|nr:hypothetical protein CROQUDRAFT_661665 [Cronartium quercuum f. sp. fusiforme G11]